MTIRAIIFDADNTLWETDKYVLSMIKETSCSLGLNVPDDLNIKAVQSKNLPFEDIFKELFVENGPVVLAAYRARAKEKGYSATLNGVDVVTSLYQTGKVLGIMTNRTQMIEERLSQCGYLRECFDFIYPPPSAEERKPHRNAYQKAIEHLDGKGISVGEIVVVGDHLDDYVSAKARELYFVAVLTGLTKKEDFVSQGLDDRFIINDLSGLQKVLLELRGI